MICPVREKEQSIPVCQLAIMCAAAKLCFLVFLLINCFLVGWLRTAHVKNDWTNLSKECIYLWDYFCVCMVCSQWSWSTKLLEFCPPQIDKGAMHSEVQNQSQSHWRSRKELVPKLWYSLSWQKKNTTSITHAKWNQALSINNNKPTALWSTRQLLNFFYHNRRKKTSGPVLMEFPVQIVRFR